MEAARARGLNLVLVQSFNFPREIQSPATRVTRVHGVRAIVEVISGEGVHIDPYSHLLGPTVASAAVEAPSAP